MTREKTKAWYHKVSIPARFYIQIRDLIYVITEEINAPEEGRDEGETPDDDIMNGQ